MSNIQSASDKKLELINRARDVLRGKRQSSDELHDLYKELEKSDQFAYAADVLLMKMKLDEESGNPVLLEEHQSLAKFIYKDHSLPSSFKFDRAQQELNAHDDLSKTKRCETLGHAGAIYKYKWLFDHQPKNLELSLSFYRRGYKSWKKYLKLNDEEKNTENFRNDDGYTAINYAYILELMAMDKLEGIGNVIDVSDTVTTYLKVSIKVRKFILNQFIKDRKKEDPVLKNDICPNWVIATVAEAFFGLRQYDSAAKFIKEYMKREKSVNTNGGSVMDVDDKIAAWKIRTFSRQLRSIAYLQHIQKEWAKKAINNPKFKKNIHNATEHINIKEIMVCLAILGASPAYIRTPNGKNEMREKGKLGLALSGGGFRASLFHIGVLASLAEQDKLKDVEVISCVSGGSILGAFYYLRLKKLLEEKTDLEIETEDYIRLVKELECEFLESIQKNLRMRILSNFICNLKMLFNKSYSRTHRLGELYEKYLYKKVLDKGKMPMYMSDLIIEPKGETNEFNIESDNWKRINKIPQLILNATSVNTGHNWQFTASWMGEPAGSIQINIDAKPRLRRMYYKDARAKYKNFRLGYAVGASSCVPVMFEPMPMFDLYPDMELQLIDGGLHDNQGIAALLEQECKNMIISDASGQMPTNQSATKNEIATFYRADNILQERLRELQFKDVNERAYSTQINELISLHLKKDLQKMPVSWIDCTDPPREIYNEKWCEDSNDFTKYGILRSVQKMLSEIRTDLDSFNDTEAHALSFSGYV